MHKKNPHPIFCAVLCFFAAIPSGCTKRGPVSARAASSQILRISQRNEPADLDPARASLPDELFIIRALSEGLVAPAPELASPQPAAAVSWDISADQLTYTFHLRPDARWSNGEPVTASDFLASYQRVLSPATAAPKAPLLFMVKNARAYATGELNDFAVVGFRALDPLTLAVTLERAQPRFLAYVASGPWIPVNPRVVAQFGRAWTRPGHFVGNGAFTLSEWRPNQRIVVKKNPAYHDADRIHLDEIQFIAFDNGDAEERAFRAGQLDVTMAVPYTKLETYRREHPGELHHAPLAETRYLSFNTTRTPLDDPRVRTALSLAIDRHQLVERVLHGEQIATVQLLPPALLTAEEQRGRLELDPRTRPDTARQLLTEAGFPGGRGFPRLELSTWPVGGPVTEVIQAMWKKELGIEVTLVTREAKVHVAALREARYDIAFVTAIPDVADPANLLGDFTTGAPGNYPHWHNGDYDKLVAEPAGTFDAAIQSSHLTAIETCLDVESPIAPLYYNATNWLMRPAVQGWHQDPLWTRFYEDVYLHEN